MSFSYLFIMHIYKIFPIFLIGYNIIKQEKIIEQTKSQISYNCSREQFEKISLSEFNL